MVASKPIKRFLKITAGILLLILGCAGLFLPILQGVLMIMGGLAILSTEIPAVRAFNIQTKRRLKNLIRFRRKSPDPEAR